MTGGKAIVDPAIGGHHSAWDGYITGQNLELDPARRIVQSWRSTDFPLGSGDSHLDVIGTCARPAEGNEITIIHGEIPEGQGAQHEEGWHRPLPRADAEVLLEVLGPKAAVKKKPAKKAAKAKPWKAGAKKAPALRRRRAVQRRGRRPSQRRRPPGPRRSGKK